MDRVPEAPSGQNHGNGCFPALPRSGLPDTRLRKRHPSARQERVSGVIYECMDSLGRGLDGFDRNEVRVPETRPATARMDRRLPGPVHCRSRVVPGCDGRSGSCIRCRARSCEAEADGGPAFACTAWISGHRRDAVTLPQESSRTARKDLGARNGRGR